MRRSLYLCLEPWRLLWGLLPRWRAVAALAGLGACGALVWEVIARYPN